MRGSPLFVLLALSLTLAASACSKKKKPAGPPAYEAMCVKSCERVSGCNGEVDPEECRLDCISAFMPYGSHLREDFVQEIEQCMLDARCRDLGSGALDNACRADATERVPVSLKTLELCDAVMETLTRCTLGVSALRQEACQQSFKILDDETLAEAIHCRDVECKELGQCFTAAFGFSAPMVLPVEDDTE